MAVVTVGVLVGVELLESSVRRFTRGVHRREEGQGSEAAAQQAAEADGRTASAQSIPGAGQGSPGWLAHGKLNVGRSLAAIR